MSQDNALIFEVPSVAEALRRGSLQLGVEESRLEASIIEEEKGFLGIFGKKLKVEVKVLRESPSERGVAFLRELIEKMRLDVVPNQAEECINLDGPDAKILISRYGDPLKAMEYILNLCIRNPNEGPRLRLDSEGYRDRRASTLERIAESAARKALRNGMPVRLDPMSGWERRIIHLTLKDREDITTESVGQAPDRKVVVLPKVEINRSYKRRSR
jgi:spoIIIJ-associated protein